MNITNKINGLLDKTNFLIRLRGQFPDVKIDGHYFYSSTINTIADHVDIIMYGPFPMAMPYVVFEDEPIFCEPMEFSLATDEGYEIEWRQDMQANGINPAIIPLVEQAQRIRNGRDHYGTPQSRDFHVDCNYGSRRFGYQ